MASVLEQAREFLAKAGDLTREALGEALKALPKDVQDAYWDMRKAAYFTPENQVGDSINEIMSPSGKYKLVVSRFTTGPGSWNYSQGVVFAIGSDTPIATVRRNYGAFPNAFVEGHPKGDFLVCGADYQGQTVVNLTTGERRDHLPKAAGRGAGFCWSSYRYDATNAMLIVAGCFWACPYEYRFFDFSDPMSGWPEIESSDGADDDDKWPEVLPDGTIRCFQTYQPDDDEDEEDEGAPKEKRPSEERSIKTFRREGLKLVLIEEWVSEAEQGRRKRNEEARIRYEQEVADFKASDPLYLTYIELVKDPALSPDSYEGVGVTYEGWCPDFKERERRWCRRIVGAKRDAKGQVIKGEWTIDLEWATKTGPIKLVIYQGGKASSEGKFFEHSVDGMRSAFSYAKGLIGGIS